MFVRLVSAQIAKNVKMRQAAVGSVRVVTKLVTVNAKKLILIAHTLTVPSLIQLIAVIACLTLTDSYLDTSKSLPQ